jgi:ABC-type dipeptide/oligopeptide/nickel transport system ATPase component
MTMLCVTHEMGFARQVANRVIFMDQGQIVEQNEPEEFFDNPQHERTKLFLSQILHGLGAVQCNRWMQCLDRTHAKAGGTCNRMVDAWSPRKCANWPDVRPTPPSRCRLC